MKINNNIISSSSFSKGKATYPSRVLTYTINPPKGYIWSVLQEKFIKDIRQ